MKRFLFIFQILILTIFISGGSGDIEATNVNFPAWPSGAKDKTYYKQLEQNGNFYTDRHDWLRNGNNHIQVGISFFHVASIGNAVAVISPVLSVDETFAKGDLLAEIAGVSGTTELHAPCAGVVKGINPLIATPMEMPANQMWIYKCELRRGELGTLMNDAEYANFTK